MSLLGTTIGRIRLVDRLGMGGMGEVYAGIDETLGRKVAVKCVQVGDRGAKVKGRFLQEARILSRLAHPNICQIYDFIESDERDFLVMELVEGRGLDEALRAGLDHKSKLTIAQRVADVLVAAHAEGVVHRDLKPEHVMLTADGEVKVLDFGVAHSLALDSDETVDFSGPLTSHKRFRAYETVVGSVVGTPRYMSPEQARGEPVTPASDMYTFGLLLQEMLTGRPALDRKPLKELLTEVAEGRSEPVEGLGRALTELVEGLKSLLPGQRPTAKETADRLRFIRETPRRWLRRGAVAAAVLLVVAGTVKYTVDLRHERAEAVAAREQAEDLVTFMIEDLTDELRPIGKLGLLEQVARKTLDYYEQARPGSTGEPAYRRGRAYYSVSEVLGQGGDLEAALEATKSAQEIHQRLVDESPDRAEWQNALALDHLQLGEILRVQGHRPEALASLIKARALALRLVEEEPGNDAWLRTLGEAYYALGLFYVFHDFQEAEEPFREGLAIFRRLAEKNPGEPYYKYRQAVLYGQGLGQTYRNQGKVEASLEAIRRAYALYEEVTRAEPSNTRWLHGFAWENRRLADHYGRQGQLEEALAAMRKSKEITEGLVRQEPSQSDWQLALSMDHEGIGELLGDQGDLQAALDSYRAALEIRRKLAEADPTHEFFREHLARIHLQVGTAWSRLGNAREAERSWQRSLEQTAPDVGETGDAHDNFLEVYAEAALLLGRVEDARPVVERLRESGWLAGPASDELLELCRRYGLPTGTDPG
jgi:tetratricopeptide (TPR) repeat protein/predicted Ser/Thr protein kinase